MKSVQFQMKMSAKAILTAKRSSFQFEDRVVLLDELVKVEIQGSSTRLAFKGRNTGSFF